MHKHTILPYHHLGEKVFAPILTANVNWLKSVAMSEQYDLICFGARDGYVVKEAFDESECSVLSKYLYGSRAAYYLAAITDERDWLFEKVFQIPQDQTVDSVLNRLCLWTDNDIQQDLKPYLGIRLKNLSEFEYLYLREKVWAALVKHSSAYRETIRHYWRHEGLEHKKVFFWDAGWNGTQARAIEKIVDLLEFPINIDFGFFHLIDLASSSDWRSNYSTCISNSDLSTNDKEGLYKAIPLLDTFFSAPEPSVLMFTADSSRFVTYDHVGNSNWQYVSEIQRGALDGLLHTCPGTAPKCIEPLLALVNNPSSYDLSLFSALNCSTAYGTEKYNKSLRATVWG